MLNNFIKPYFIFFSILVFFGKTSLCTQELTVTLSTEAYADEYGGDNYLAAWIVDSSLNYVDTIAVHVGFDHPEDLVDWYNVTQNASLIDGVSGATRTDHSPISFTWDLKAHGSQTTVLDGDYTLKLEMSDTEYADLFLTARFDIPISISSDNFQINTSADYFPSVQVNLNDRDSTDSAISIPKKPINNPGVAGGGCLLKSLINND